LPVCCRIPARALCGSHPILPLQTAATAMVPPTVCGTKADGAGPLLAQSRHAQCADKCPLLGAKRTLTNRCLPVSIYEYTP